MLCFESFGKRVRMFFMNTIQIIDAIRKVYHNGIPCDELDPLLIQHDCLYLLLKQGKYQARKPINRSIYKIRYSTCSGMFQKLQNIPYAVMKGAVLAKHAYGDEGVRLSSDLDILVSRSSYSNVKEVLLSEGFIQGTVYDGRIIPFKREEIVYHLSKTHQAATFVKHSLHSVSPYVFVDVNFDVFWGESGIHTDIDFFLQNVRQESILGYPINVLTPVFEFIALCLHHYKHMNSIYLLMEQGVHLYLLCDILEFLLQNPLDPFILKKHCEQLQALPYVYFCIYHTNSFFGRDLLQSYVDVLYTEQGYALLDCIGLDNNERRHIEFSFADRLFCKNFYEKIARELNDEDRDKIATNIKYMMNRPNN